MLIVLADKYIDKLMYRYRHLLHGVFESYILGFQFCIVVSESGELDSPMLFTGPNLTVKVIPLPVAHLNALNWWVGKLQK